VTDDIMRCLCRDLTSGKLPKDGYLLGDVEVRGIIEAFADDNAIFQAVRDCRLTFQQSHGHAPVRVRLSRPYQQGACMWQRPKSCAEWCCPPCNPDIIKACSLPWALVWASMLEGGPRNSEQCRSLLEPISSPSACVSLVVRRLIHVCRTTQWRMRRSRCSAQRCHQQGRLQLPRRWKLQGSDSSCRMAHRLMSLHLRKIAARGRRELQTSAA